MSSGCSSSDHITVYPQVSPQAAALCRNLNSAWFPVNPVIYARVRKGLRSGLYNNDVTALVEEVKSDFSLFGYCVRELSKLVQRADPASCGGRDPIELFYAVELEQLRSILSVDIHSISKHSFADISNVQARRLYQSVASATVAEALAPACEINPDTSFCCALFRQLGLTLIAWNYPHLYQRALSDQPPPGGLDQALGKMLGMSPALLGLTLAREWRISSNVLCGMTSPRAEEGPSVRRLGERLRKVCEVGEALARANDPAHYPTSAQDWSAASQAIEKILGRHGLAVILDKIDSRCREYEQFCPELFNDSVRVKVNESIRHSVGQWGFERNPHIAKCPVFLRDQLEQLYMQLDGRSVSSEAVQTLVKQCILAVGFSRGCVYLLEPDRRALVPRLTMGDSRLCRYKVATYSLEQGPLNPIVEAYNSCSVLVTGNAVLCLAGALGSMERLGVLYLEIPKLVVEAKQASIVDCFCAINQALGDCLNIQ